MKSSGDTVTTDIKSCARCGHDHDALEFRPLAEPAGEDTHWAPCPVTGDPILMRVANEGMGALASALASAAEELSAVVEQAVAELDDADIDNSMTILEEAGWELVGREGDEPGDKVVRLLGSYLVNTRTQPAWMAPNGGATNDE